MRRYFSAFALSIISTFSATTTHAGTPNTTAAGAVSYEVGAGWVTHSIDEANQNRWFIFTEVAGRSYCVEAALGVATYFPLDPNATVYSDAAGTVVLFTNDNGASEPPMTKGARVCYVSPLTPPPSGAPPTGTRLFKVNVPIVAGSGDSGFVRVRVIETTLWADTYSVNTSPTTDNTVTIFNSSNTSVTGSFYLVGWGQGASVTTNRQIKSSVGLLSKMPGVSGAQTGQLYYAHNGPPGAISGWITLSDQSLHFFYPR